MKPRFSKRIREINSGGFADIAFMLLFFFLITSQLEEEKGIRTQLPPPDAVAAPSDREIAEIIVNANDQILLDKQPIKMDALRTELYGILSDKGHDKVSFVLKNHEATSYATYLKIYSSLKGAYKDLRNEYARQHFGTTYSEAHPTLKKHIEKQIPLRIAETSL